MSEDTLVFSIIIGAIVLWIAGVMIKALFSDKYDKGKMDEHRIQQEYYSWLRTKNIDDLIIRKIVPMVELLSSSGKTHTMSRTHYKKNEDFVELEGGVILDKSHIEQRKYFFLGEGVINNNKHSEKKQLMLFKADGIEFTSKDNIEWMTTYGLYEASKFDYHLPSGDWSRVLVYKNEEQVDFDFWGEKGHWDEKHSSYYGKYLLMMKKIDEEEEKLTCTV